MKLSLLILSLLLYSVAHPQTLGKRKRNTSTQVSRYMTTPVEVKMKLKLPFSNEQKDYYVKKAGNFFILNDDLIVGTDIPKTMSYAINDGDYRWPDATIPIVIDPSIYTMGLADNVLQAVKEFNSKTELCVIQRTTEKDYIKIIHQNIDAGGRSAVGKQGGEQILILSSNSSVRTAIHELMHAAGFYHEQSREDRDNYVNINYDNIQDDKKNNFQFEGGAPIGNYDYCSIMHYSSNAFAKPGAGPTIICVADLDNCKECLGQATTFSQQDIESIDMFYSSVSRFPCNTPFPGSVTSTVRFPTVNISESDKAQQSFRHRAEYASKNGFAGGFPNFHEARYGNDIVGGTILLKHGLVKWEDVPLSWLGNVQLNDFAGRMRATQNYAVNNGFVGGFPNYFHADYGKGIVCGTFLLGNAVAEWRDVPINELGNPNLDDIGARMRSANDYAFRNGFLGGFPTFYHADYGKGIVCGIILIKKEAGEWRDVVIAAGPR